MIGERAPAYGLWTRHVRNRSLERVAFTRTAPDTRPMIGTQDTSELARIGC
jgi:hypothetical protein